MRRDHPDFIPNPWAEGAEPEDYWYPHPVPPRRRRPNELKANILLGVTIALAFALLSGWIPVEWLP